MAEPSPTERELEALKVLWTRGEATVRDVADAINAGAEKSSADQLAYTTVLSLLQDEGDQRLRELRWPS